MKESTAATVGFLVAAVPPALMLGLLTPISREGPDPVAVIGLFPIGYAFSILFVGVFGVPAFFLARRFRLIRWWSTVTVGFAIGVAAAFILKWPTSATLGEVLPLAITGAVSGLIFWIIWDRNRQSQIRRKDVTII